MPTPTERFSNRVDNYVKYRPGYPPAVLDLLAAECGLTPASVIADIGSGTGILTRLFLERGQRVYGVEPNREMRAAGERLLAGFAGFTSVPATAEQTTLPDRSVDFVTAGQAFHWFDRAAARREFERILRPDGWVVLLWNSRAASAGGFQADYEQFIREHSNLGPSDFERFFGPGGYRQARFANRQVFDFDGLRGRFLSASYAPEPDHPGYGPMLAALRRLFDAHQVDGMFAIDYDTVLYYGQFTAG
jgi:SAM-dependent methyltransferase